MPLSFIWALKEDGRGYLAVATIDKCRIELPTLFPATWLQSPKKYQRQPTSFEIPRQMKNDKDKEYLQILLDSLRICADYRPKFGLGGKAGVSPEQFQEQYQDDQFYNWLGLGTPMVYATHKAAGGITSIYRQIGIGSERLIRRIF